MVKQQVIQTNTDQFQYTDSQSGLKRSLGPILDYLMIEDESKQFGQSFLISNGLAPNSKLSLLQ